MTLQVGLALIVNFCVIVGFLWQGLRVLTKVQKGIIEMVIRIGQKSPPEGLLGDVEALKNEVRKHRDRLIRLEVNQGLKIEDRT